MDRHAINQALAKCVAYQNVGKDQEAREWFERLADLLGYNTGPRADYRMADDLDIPKLGPRVY
jgi:hypothetical protein